MKKIPIASRILIVASAVWFIYWLIQGWTDPNSRRAADSYYVAIIPLVIFWGIYWITQGIKEKRKVRGNQKKDV